MINYREQNGCHNCRHVFLRYEYDDTDEYYCTLNAPERPMCNSVNMNEWAGTVERSMTLATHDRIEKAWRAWKKDREVKAWGICDAWAAGEGQ